MHRQLKLRVKTGWNGDRRQRDKEKKVPPIYPWDNMLMADRDAEEQPIELLPLDEVSIRKNNQFMRVNKSFSYQEIRESRKIWETIGGFRKTY